MSGSGSLIPDSLRDTVRPVWISCHFEFLRRSLFVCALGMLVAGATKLPGQTQGNSNSQKTTADSDTPVTVSGRVVNASTGLPVSRALVRFNDRAVLTAHDGKFEFTQVTDASSNLQVSKPGFYPNSEPGGSTGIYLRTSQITAALELRLYPEALFTGTLTAPDGEPLSHIVVSARRSTFDGSGGHTWIPIAQAQTDSHGQFRLPVPSGDYKLESMYVPRINGTDQAALPIVVPSENSSNTSSFISIRSGEEQHFELHPVTSRAYSIAATFDSDIERGFPRITARSSNGSIISLPVRFSHSEPLGSTRMELPSGTYTLIATVMSQDGIQQGETTITVTNHDVTGVVFHLSPVPTLPIELVLDGAATSDNTQPNLRQLGLTLEQDQFSPDIFSSAVSLSARRDGSMVFTAPTGSYRLHARNNGGAWYIKSASYGASDLLQQNIVVAPGGGGTPIRITVSNQTASLQGTCKLSGTPSACWVYLIPTTPSASSVFLQQANTQGVYNYAHLPPGSYEAVAFERIHSADYGDPATLTTFGIHVRAVTVNAGEKPTLDLDAVSEAEMAP